MHWGAFWNFASSFQLYRCWFKEFSSENLPCWVIEVHGFFGFVVGSHSEWNDFHRGEARGHGQDLGPMSRFIQVFLGLRVGHSCRVPAHNVEIGPCNHPGPAVPLDLGNITERTCWSSLANPVGSLFMETPLCSALEVIQRCGSTNNCKEVSEVSKTPALVIFLVILDRI